MQAYLHRLKNTTPRAQTGMRGKDASSSASSVSGDQDGLDGAQDGATVNQPIVTATTRKTQAPQSAIDEFWGKFDSKTPGRASAILPRDKYARRLGETIPKGVVPGENAVASYAYAVKLCKDKVRKIVQECRRVNQKYRDPHFDIEFDLKWGVGNCLTMLANTSDAQTDLTPGSVKRVEDIFEKPEFYKGGATANDIRQGNDGDCWFMSALCTLGSKPGLIEKVCVARDETVGVYGFVFYRDGEWISEVIDDKLYLTKPDYDEGWLERTLIDDARRVNSEEDYRKIYQTGSGALYFAQCEDPNETWLPLLEKAYAKAHGDYAAIEGGFTGEGLEDLTGGVTTELLSSDILDKDHFWTKELLNVNKEFLFGCAAGIFWGPWGERKGIIEGHAYSILKAVEIDGKRLCLLRNPWGKYEWNGPWSDGSKEWTPEWMQKLDHRFGDDGAFWMSYEDLLKKYQTFDRTRLFDEDWKVTQQWTTLTVPWTADYHSTKFFFTIEKKTSVVLVLSQLDTRYFCGLEGQYRFQLSFRLHKAGDEDYLVRSQGNYCMSRSVTTELELEEGEYHVLVKVTAEKMAGALPVEDVVRNNAKDRSDKLQRIGLSYDLAHAKGQIKETNEEKNLRKKLEAKKKAKAQKEMKDQLMKEKKKRKHNDNKELRKQRAAAEKTKAKAKVKAAKKVEKEKAEKEKKEQAEKAAKEKKDVAEKKVKAKEDFEEASKAKATNQPLLSNTNPEETKAEVVIAPMATEGNTPAEPLAKLEGTLTATTAPDILLNGSVPPSTAGLSDIDDDDDEELSDIESVISDISIGVVDDAIEEAKLAAANNPAPTADESEDEFVKDPWNAVAVVGLRVYCRGGEVGVKVVRPEMTMGDVLGKKGDTSDVGLGDSKLDVDDSAKDATKVVESVIRKKKEGGDGTSEGESLKGDSEGSIVMV